MYNHFLTTYSILLEHGVDDPLQDTLHLIALASAGAMRRDDQSQSEQGIDLSFIAQRRRQGMPLEYAVGKAIFMGIEFSCTPETLIPRDETELLASAALDWIAERQRPGKQLTIVDLGTGCGNIAVTLAAHTEGTSILASDISEAAVTVAQANVDRHGLQDRVVLLCGDLFSPICEQGLAGQVDLVVCNPPYIPSTSLDGLAAEIVDYEPRIALDAGAYGLQFFRRLVRGALSVLRPGGRLLFEIGEGQEKLVTRLVQRTGSYQDITHIRNGAHIRVIGATRTLEEPANAWAKLAQASRERENALYAVKKRDRADPSRMGAGVE